MVSVLRTNQGPSRANIEKTSQLPGLILDVTECEQPIEKNLQQTEKCSGKGRQDNYDETEENTQKKNEDTKNHLRYTDRSNFQLSWVITKNYSTTPKVPKGIWR